MFSFFFRSLLNFFLVMWDMMDVNLWLCRYFSRSVGLFAQWRLNLHMIMPVLLYDFIVWWLSNCRGRRKSHSGKCCMHLNAVVVSIDSHIIIKKNSGCESKTVAAQKSSQLIGCVSSKWRWCVMQKAFIFLPLRLKREVTSCEYVIKTMGKPKRRIYC